MSGFWQRSLGAVSSDLGLKLFSLAFALGLWLFVNAGQKATERVIEVPLEFRNLPSNVMIADFELSQVELRVMGPPALLATLDPDRLKAVLDLDGAKPGTSTLRLSPEFFNPPRGVRITRVSPSVFNLKLEAVAVRSLPVAVRFGGKPPFGYKVGRVEVHPESVKVRGPANEVNRMGSVETIPLELDGGRGPITREVRLATGGKPISLSPDRVTVSVTMEEESMTREFVGIEVRARDFSGSYHVSPRQVSLVLSGPKRLVAQLQVGREQVYLDLKGLKPGTHMVPLSFDLPAEVKVMELRPKRFKVQITGPERS